MELGINLEYYIKNIGLEKAAKAVGEAGIKLLDYIPQLGTEREEWGRQLDVLNKNGLKVYQCHAPFNRYENLGDTDSYMKLLNESVEMAQFFDARYLVVHGDEFDFANLEYSPEAAMKYNYELFAPIVEKLSKKGIHVAFENVFEDNFKGKKRYSSNTEDLINIIDKFDNEYVCCCWDFGHGAVQLGEKCVDGIRALGKRIECTHVHDNYYEGDLHLVPFFGKMDWKRNMDAMKETKCDVLSFELVYGEIPENVVPNHVKMLAEVGETLNGLLK